MSADREEALALNRSFDSLQNAMTGFWDARQRGDIQAFEFYQRAIKLWCEAVAQWAGKTCVKASKE